MARRTGLEVFAIEVLPWPLCTELVLLTGFSRKVLTIDSAAELVDAGKMSLITEVTYSLRSLSDVDTPHLILHHNRPPK